MIDADKLKERWTIASPEPYNTDTAEVLEALIRRLDKQKAKIKRVEWAIASIREEGFSKMGSDAEKADALLKMADFIEKVMEE